MTTKRMLAEWERQASILMAFPTLDSDWGYIYPEAVQQFSRIVKALTDNGVKVKLLCKDLETAREAISKANQELVSYIEADYNDTWTRDYGPITIEEDSKIKELDFGFNGWGLKFAADRDNLVNLRLSPAGRYKNQRDFVLEGGSIESDGRGTILTTSQCLTSDNRNGGKTKSELEPILKERLGAERILWLDHGSLAGDDTDSHIDTLARLAPGESILYVRCDDETDSHYKELAAMRRELEQLRTADGKPYSLIALPLPSPIYSKEGERLPATYANYLVTNDVVFVPTYNQPANDAKAMEAISSVFKGRKIVGVDCTTLIEQHGSLHCTTMQLY